MMTRAAAIETAQDYRELARKARRMPIIAQVYYALARKYLRKARDCRKIVPNKEISLPAELVAAES